MLPRAELKPLYDDLVWLYVFRDFSGSEADLAAEHEARTLYIEARDHCESVSDYVSKDLFEELIADEEGHIDFLETQLDLYESLGQQGYGLLNAKAADEAEG